MRRVSAPPCLVHAVLSALLALFPLAGAARGDGPAAAPPAPATAATPVLVDDFGNEPADRWKGRNLSVGEMSVPAGTTPSSGGILELGLDGKTGSIERSIDVADWRAFDAVSLFVAVDGATPQPFRIVVSSGKAGRGLLRRFTAAPGPWREVVLPLRDFREDGGDVLGTFAGIERVRIQWDEGKGKARVDDLRLLPGTRGTASCRMTNDDRLRLAFPGGDGKVTEGGRFAVFSNVPQLQGDKAKPLLARLEEGAKVLADRFAIAGEPEERVPLHVFRTKAEYQAFVARMAEHFGANVAAPEHDGFTVFGVPSSTWDAKQGWDRPVYVHEAVHGLVYRLAAISANGNWLQEGLASAVQTRIHPKSMPAGDILKAFQRLEAGEKGPFVAWKEVLFERRPSVKAYAQLASICEFLADRAGRDLTKVWWALAESSKPLHEGGIAIVATSLGAKVEDLEKEWLAWGLKTPR